MITVFQSTLMISYKKDKTYNTFHTLCATIKNLKLISFFIVTFISIFLVTEYAMLITILHANVGSEIGAHFVEEFNKVFLQKYRKMFNFSLWKHLLK